MISYLSYSLLTVTLRPGRTPFEAIGSWSMVIQLAALPTAKPSQSTWCPAFITYKRASTGPAARSSR